MFTNIRFVDVLKALPRRSFQKLVQTYQSDRYSKRFSSWDHLLAMIYAQLSGTRGLRELEVSFNAQSLHHYHLGTGALKRSTLADANHHANAHQRCEVFAALCTQLLQQTHRRLRRELSELLYLIDSTPITLNGPGYEWAEAKRIRHGRGLKVHLMISPQAEAPVWSSISAPNVNDLEEGKRISLEKQATYVFDKAYCDYNWWYEIQQCGAQFVTRLKKNAGVQVEQTHPIAEAAQGIILEDTTITFKHKHPGGHRKNRYHGTPLRRIVVKRAEREAPLVLVTNDFQRSALEIADLYKQRWAIELFFKWIKQNLKIKQFLGRSEIAVKIQIYTALITYMLLLHYRKFHSQTESLKLCLATLKTSLFQRPTSEYQYLRKRRSEQRLLLQLQQELPI